MWGLSFILALRNSDIMRALYLPSFLLSGLVPVATKLVLPCRLLLVGLLFSSLDLWVGD